MASVLAWAGDDGCAPAQEASSSIPLSPNRGRLPEDVSSFVWRGTELGNQLTPVQSSGFVQLDRELPGGGWPCQSLCEILSPQPSLLEWRLLGPALQKIVARNQSIAVIGPPKVPHLPGIRFAGIDERHLVWLQADTPASRLWCTEQLVKANCCGAVLAWLPQARPEQIRRLQVCAQACEGLVFLFRPAAAQHEPSAAPLRLMATFGLDWELHLQVLKRKGPVHDGLIRLASIPGGLESVLTPRARRPSELLRSRERPADMRSRDVVGGTHTPPLQRRLASSS